ncbi:MAG: general secretion pathway protein GspB [Candidatus Omnitrophota bacterium]
MRKILLLVLALILVFSSSDSSIAAPAKKPVAKKPVAKKPVAKKPVAKKGAVEEVDKDVGKDVKKEKYKSRSEIKYTGFDSKRDPFSPPEVVVKMLEKPEGIPGAEILAKDIKLPAIDLQGIIWSKNIPQVIINGGVMKVGDFIEEFEIKEIRRTGIILFFKGNDYFIKMVGYTQKNTKKKKR